MARKNRPSSEDRERYRPSDIVALIVASLQIILPIAVMMVAAVAVAYGVFVLLFR